ncbi:MAG: hypothetical protein WBG70_18745 [Spirulinaceae cyanobacterium]
MYFFPEPPYFLLVFGLFAGMTSGVAFESTLKEKVQQWSKDRKSNTLADLQGFQLFLPYLGICAGICIFLAAGVEIFGFEPWLSYGLSLFLTILIGWLIWTQLGKVLQQLERGGSKALDLDSWE